MALTWKTPGGRLKELREKSGCSQASIAKFYDRTCGVLKGAKLTEALRKSRHKDKERERRLKDR